MQLSALQIVLLVLVAAEINVDRRGLSLTHARPVIVGFHTPRGYSSPHV